MLPLSRRYSKAWTLNEGPFETDKPTKQNQHLNKKEVVKDKIDSPNVQPIGHDP